MPFSLRRAVVAGFLALTLIATPVWAANWVATAAKVQKSLVSIQTDPDGEIYCSGAVIDNERDFVLTAEHCTGLLYPDGTSVGMYVDGKQAWVVWKRAAFDIAILKVEGLNRDSIKPGDDPQVGQEVAALGFGYGFGGLGMFRTGSVSGYTKFSDVEGVLLTLGFSAIPGMSGGPIVDLDGKLVGIIQSGDDAFTVTWGRDIEDIYKLTSDFWENKRN